MYLVLHMILFYPLKICKLLKLIIEAMINLYIYNNIHWNDFTIPVPRISYQTICNIVMMYMLYNMTVKAVMKMTNRGFCLQYKSAQLFGRKLNILTCTSDLHMDLDGWGPVK